MRQASPSDSDSALLPRPALAADRSSGGEILLEAESDSPLNHRLKLYFALLSCLGGIVLGTGDDTEGIAAIAVFFAVFGFVCVDWLKLFALPPVAAYAAMAVVAVYCVVNFIDFDAPNSRQMRAVAELLVLVQAIMMLQKKTYRIYEQLGVFCLLELIVAAVFNNAINYGLLLVPIALIGAWALSLLVVLRSSQTINASPEEASSPIRYSSAQAKASMESATDRLPWVVLLTIAPAVLLVAAIYFYALPRTTEASRSSGHGDAMVGFSDQMRLEQIGQMTQNDRLALRVQLKDRKDNAHYDLEEPLYLRGKVLERYRPSIRDGQPSAIWMSINPLELSEFQPMPPEVLPQRAGEKDFYDTVDVRISCESTRSPSLFAIAPFHRTTRGQEIVHAVDRWTISRREQVMPTFAWSFPRINYEFGTHAYKNGVQSEVIARWSNDADWREPLDSIESPDARRRIREMRLQFEDYDRQYQQVLRNVDVDQIPAADRMAERVVDSISDQQPTSYTVAKRLERSLVADGEFRYTLNLDAEPIPGLDPIEQFLAHDRRGNCQYFASALVMMLRSQGIPSRLVVGYKTEEYNALGKYYVVRQLHAHAWVEALIEKNQLPATVRVSGQTPSDQYWLRLDPTPSVNLAEQPTANGVNEVFDLAQNMWDDYVVDMDSSRQQDALLEGRGVSPISDAYAQVLNSIQVAISRIQAGQLGGGSLAGRSLFSWPAALFGIGMTLAVFVLVRFKMPTWVRSQRNSSPQADVAKPGLAFYSETLEQLARLGLRRRACETPAEFTSAASQETAQQKGLSLSEPLSSLTATYYRLRFGPPRERKLTPVIDSDTQQALSELKRRIDRLKGLGSPQQSSAGEFHQNPHTESRT